jgi:hypothetical protein
LRKLIGIGEKGWMTKGEIDIGDKAIITLLAKTGISGTS